ncbi:MAG TPA: aldo/keto reductase [Phycisphaerae bacterium]|nr:aldo/keto reductase [Phycisphaerae bacterium]
MASPQHPDPKQSGIGRRDFLRGAVAAGAGLAAHVAGRAHGAESDLERRNEKPGIVYRRLGRTNFAVSALGVGGYILTAERMPLFEAAVDRGVNFIMAHAGKCVEALGPWLKKPGNRERIFLGLAGETRTVDAQLRKLGTDCIDLLMVPIHSAEPVLQEELPKAFAALKKAGKARFLCLVFHANVPAVWRNGLKVDWFDAFLPVYNMASRDSLKPLVAQTTQKDIGLLAMKTLKGMPKGKDPLPTWKAFLADGFASILKGITSTTELDLYLRVAAKDDRTAARADRFDCSGECTLCGACDACPNGVAIQDILRTWQYYGRQLGWTDEARDQYAAIPATSQAPVCADCGRCERVCVRGLAVRRLVREAHAALA